MTILGVDPGTATTGLGIIKVINKKKHQFKCLDYSVIKTTPQSSRAQRLRIIHNKVVRAISDYQPQLVGVETLFFFKNQKTACKVSEARGVILLAAAKKKVAVEQVSPLEVKMGICNYGRATKKQVQKMLKKILRLKEIPEPDDAADALAVAICSAYKNRG